MSNHYLKSPALVLERIAYGVLAAALGVGLLSIVVAGFRTSLPDAFAGRAVTAQVCEQPSSGPIASVVR